MPVVKCDNCGIEVIKDNSDIKRTKHNFCSRSCSVTFSNNTNPKRKLDENITLEEYRKRGEYRTYKSRVCEYARRKFKNKHPNHRGCIACGYKRYFEICHIKPISDFPMDTKLIVANDIYNLAPLCPTCHWEFDHDFLSKDKVINLVKSMV